VVRLIGECLNVSSLEESCRGLMYWQVGGYGCTHSELWHQDAGRWTNFELFYVGKSSIIH